MAVAGKVAITPKGEWNAQTDYTKLDLVFYDNASYVAIKPSTGVIPTDESCWMLVVQSAGGADFEGIINGDIQVGNAKSLDGHEAEYFAKAESVAEINLGEINILESELDTLVKDYEISNGVTYTASIRPKTSSDGKYIFGGINFGLIGMEYGNNTQGFQLGISGSLIKMRRLNSGTWGEWKTLATLADLAKYLPLDGSVPISRMLTIGTYDLDGSATLLLQNKYRNMYWQVLKDGRVAFVDGSNGGGIKMEFSADGTTNTFVGHASKDLPLTGGTLTDSLFVKRTDNTSILVVTENALNKLISGVNGSGVSYMQDKNGNVIVCNTDGTRTFYGHSSEDLPLNGGGTVKRQSRKVILVDNISEGATGASMGYNVNGTPVGELGIKKDGTPFYSSSGDTLFSLLHTGNGATYEEGTFDLTLEGRTLSGYKYTKIGNFVYLSGLVSFNGEPLTIENTAIEVHGLPFGISSIAYFYFGDTIYTPPNKATNNLVNYVPGGTYFGIGGGGTTSFAVGTPCVLHAMYITD